MTKKSPVDLNTLLEPFYQSRLFPLLVITLVFVSIIRFSSHGLIQPLMVDSVDYIFYYNWATNQVGPPDWDKFIMPFLPLPYTPFWAIIMFPFKFFPMHTGKYLWYFCNLAMYFGFIYQSYLWIHKSRVFSKISYLEIVIPLIIMFNFMPLLQTLRTGQANMIVLFFVMLSFVLFEKNRLGIAAFCLAVAILTKITPGFLILFWLIKKEYKMVVFTFIWLVLLWLASIPVGGIQLQLDYFRWIIYYPFHFFQHPQANDNNVSIYALICDLFKRGDSLPILSLVLFAIFIISLLTCWYRILSAQKGKPLMLEYGWSLAFIPLLTQYTEEHHFVYLGMLYIGIWLYLDRKITYWVWLGLILSWIIISCTFSFYDLKLMPSSFFLGRYLLMLSVLLAWISTGRILYSLKNNLD